LMIRSTLRPAIAPASLVACRWASLKYAGTVTTAWVTWHRRHKTRSNHTTVVKQAKQHTPAQQRAATRQAAQEGPRSPRESVGCSKFRFREVWFGYRF
jgi:hypothetical protein